MSMNNIVGNLLNSDCDYICHQVNCMGKMGSGIAKQIRIKWPEVYIAYRAKCNFLNEDQGNYIRPELNLGTIQIIPTKENSNKSTGFLKPKTFLGLALINARFFFIV